MRKGQRLHESLLDEGDELAKIYFYRVYTKLREALVPQQEILVRA